MIKLFTQAGCNSSRKARQWFRDHEIAFEEKNFTTSAPTVNELKQILSLTENGLDDIISTRAQAYPSIADKLPDMSFNETLHLLCNQPQLLRRPLIVGPNKLQVGFNDDDIRQFIPRHIRRMSFQRTLAGLGEPSWGGWFYPGIVKLVITMFGNINIVAVFNTYEVGLVELG